MMQAASQRCAAVVLAFFLAVPMLILAIGTGSPVAATGNFTMVSIAHDAPRHITSGGYVGRRWYPYDVADESIAFDLSSVPAAQRSTAMVSTSFPSTVFHFPPGGEMFRAAIDYVTETNVAPGGGTPPVDGWIEIDSVTGNDIRTQQRVVELGGANWVRVRVLTASGDAFDMTTEIYSIDAVADSQDDNWLFLGDSITFPLKEELLADAVRSIDPTRAIASMNAAVPGAISSAAAARFGEVLPTFDGTYVVLAYGTNDRPDTETSLEPAVQAVIAAGMIPVIPMIPWSQDYPEEMAVLNESIEALYLEYPEIIPGPDLYAAFEDRLDLFPPNDVHPNEAGRVVFRDAWAEMIAQTSPPVPPTTTTTTTTTTTVPPTTTTTTTVPPTTTTTTTTTTTVPPTTTTTTSVPPTTTTTTTTTVPAPTTTTVLPTTTVPPTTTTTTTVPAPTATTPTEPKVVAGAATINDAVEGPALASAVRIDHQISR